MLTPDPRYWIQDLTSVDSGFQKFCFPGLRIPRRVFRILKSRIPDSTSKYFLDSGFHKQVLPGFRIPQASTSWIPDSTSKYFLDSRFHKQVLPGFRIPQANTSWIPDFGLPYKGRSKATAKKFLLSNVKPVFPFQASKLASRFKVRNTTTLQHKHDVLYKLRYPQEISY